MLRHESHVSQLEMELAAKSEDLVHAQDKLKKVSMSVLIRNLSKSWPADSDKS